VDVLISFDSFILEPGSPIYAQIVLYVKRGVSAGAMGNGDELPSRRVLSALLGVNPNTVQKAFRILEDEGLVESRSGAKSFLTLTAETAARVRAELQQSDLAALVSAVKRSGLKKEEALALVAALWDGGTEP
jgi:GntR family transcriptional regulator